MYDKIVIALLILLAAGISLIGCKTLQAANSTANIASYAKDNGPISIDDNQNTENSIFNSSDNEAYPCKLTWVKNENGDWRIARVEN